MTRTEAANIAERAARVTKAFALADVVGPIVARLVADRVTPDQRADAARQIMRTMTDQGRADAADVAGVLLPSPRTWAIVTAHVVERVRAGTADADPLEGLPQ